MITEDAFEELRLMLARRDFVRVLHNQMRERLYRAIGLSSDRRDRTYFARLSEMALEDRKAKRFTSKHQGNWPPSWPYIMVDSSQVPSANDLYAIIQAQKPEPPMQNRGARRRQAAQQRSRR
jgi:hypothetical protein